MVLLLLSVDEIRPINVWLTMQTNDTFLSYRVVCYEKLFGTSEFVYGMLQPFKHQTRRFCTIVYYFVQGGFKYSFFLIILL